MPNTTIQQSQHRIANQTRLQIHAQGSRRRHTHQVAQTHPKPVYPIASPYTAVTPLLWVFPVSVIVFFVFVAAIIAAARKTFPSHLRVRAHRQVTSEYHAAESLLTTTELHFWHSLREAVGPRAHVLMKVRLADVLMAGPHDLAALRRVSQKHVDFLLCDPQTLRPLLALELDDTSHERPERQARDAFVNNAYAHAGLPVLHIPVSGRYDAVRLHVQIREMIEP